MTSQIINDDWNKIFEKEIDITKDLIFISSKKIQSLSRKDLRLMTKFDTREDQPDAFIRNNYFLLPVKNRGDFALVRGEGFQDIKYAPAEIFVSELGYNLESLSQGISESQYLDYAYHCGLLESFLERKGLKLTIRGRKYTPEFSFKVGKIGPITAKSTQMEVDGGFENSDTITLLEVKIGKPKNFNIRQLYYPYRSWNILVTKKTIATVFFAYDSREEIYCFWEYKFQEKEQYTSLKLVKQGFFQIVNRKEDQISLKQIAKEANEKYQKTSDWNIPQADDFSKVSAFPFKVAQGIDATKKIAEEFMFSERQSSYYRHASESLGLVKTENGKYALTKIGEQYIKLYAKDRHTLLCSLLFKMPIIDKVMTQLLEKKEISITEIAKIIERNTKYNSTTSLRRAQTIFSWFKWIENSLGIVAINKRKIIAK